MHANQVIRIASIALVLCTTKFITVGKAQDQSDFASKIDSLAHTALKEGPIAGLSVAVARDGKTLLSKGYGFANLEHDVQSTPEVVYRIRSISKMFTAVAVLQLAEQGKLSLDEDLTKFLPELSTHGQSAKVRHLLSHTSGIKNYGGPSWRKNKRLDLSPTDWLALVKDEPLDFAPGTNYSYSNAGYDLLALIIEKVSGETFPDYLRKHITEPADLKDTGYCTNQALIKKRAAPYEVVKGAIVNADAWGNYGYGSAMLCSTVIDLVKFQEALDDHRLLTAASVRLMQERAQLADGSTIGRGLGTGLGEIDGHFLVGHTGSGGGWTSVLAHYPADRLTVAVLTNTENDDNPRYIEAKKLQELIARKALGLPDPEVKDLPLPSAEALAYVGNWGDEKAASPIFEDEGKLKTKPPGYEGPGIRLLYQGEHTFALEPDPDTRLKFIFNGPKADRFEVYKNSFFTAVVKRVP
jgi:D-alanyl-D-alanine carboxypeptidase